MRRVLVLLSVLLVTGCAAGNAPVKQSRLELLGPTLGSGEFIRWQQSPPPF